MLFKAYNFILVVDLEATCCDRKTIPRHSMEIIEIGAVMVDTATLEPVSDFQIFVRPVRNPKLKPFCTELTTITQDMVDNAPLYGQAMDQLQQWLSHYPGYVFTSWGDYDRNQFQQDCRNFGVPYPFPSEHMNLKKLFSRQLNLSRKYGMGGALKLAGLALNGVHHRGIDDARNIARLLPFIDGREPLPNPAAQHPHSRRRKKQS